MRDLLRELYALIWSWWSVDRIRVGPQPGASLRLQPGDLVTIAGEHWEIVSRNADVTGYVMYGCRSTESAETADFAVFLDAVGSRCQWRSETSEFSEQDVQLWPRHGTMRERRW
ncbi:MAG TPA: hypothetical protein VHB77_10495 [Planctomycetaceae bacterium]|nr:hypothetical protein [Planctomycetaceae bacterium]